MEDERICACGSEADWEKVGSTWLCTSCRNKDLREKIDEFRGALDRLAVMGEAMYILKVDTTSINELLDNLRDEINRVDESVVDI